MRKAFDLRTLEFNDIMGRSFALFTANFVGLLRWFMIAWLIPVTAVAVIFYFALEPYDWTRVPGAEAPSLFEPGRFAAWVWIVKLASVTFAFTTGAAGVYFLAARAYVGDRPTLNETMTHVYERLPHISGAGFLHLLVILGLTAVCIVPPVLMWSSGGIGESILLGLLLWGGYPVLLLWFLGCWGLNVATTVLDDAQGLESFPRSATLTKKFRTRLIGVMLTAWLVVGAPGVPGVLTIPAMIGEAVLVEKGWPLLAEILRIGWDAVLLPLFFVPLVVYYFDMRCRKESYDLAVMARNFGIAEGEMQRFRFNPHLGYVPRGYKGPVGRRHKPVRKPQPRTPAQRTQQPGAPWGPQPGMPQQGPAPGIPVQGQPWPQQQPPPGHPHAPQQGPPQPGAQPGQHWPPQQAPHAPANPNAPPLPDWKRRRS